MGRPGLPPRGEEGFSLVESIVATVILGFIAAAMVGGMATTIATSDIHRQESEANTILVSNAETIRRLPYSFCASPLYSATSPWGPDAVTVVVKYWNSVTGVWESTCHDADGTSLFPLQLVTISVTHPGQRATASIEVVKRGP